MAKNSIISKEERAKLYRHIRHELGYPQRPVELTNQQMDSFLEMALEDYSSYVNEWLIKQSWVNVQGIEISKTEYISALTNKSNDFMRSFTHAYSRQVGLGADAPNDPKWHLKMDYVIVSANTQVYTIPAGREVNEVLWSTPPQIDQGMVDPMALSNWTAGQFGWSYLGRPANYVQPTYSLLLSAQDRDLKKRILQSELTYRITGGPNGTKLLYLYPIPGDRREITGVQWGKHYSGTKVWYFYYDNDGERDKCLEANSDVARLPSDIPVKSLIWDDLNSMAVAQVRDLFMAKCKYALGNIRGYFSGEVNVADVERTMDYRHLLEEAEKLKTETVERIFETLDGLSYVQLTEDRARIAENVNKERSYQPFMTPIIVM
jgi:hypothetical protein